MSDPQQPGESDPTQRRSYSTEPPVYPYPEYTYPAYAGQQLPYTPGWAPPGEPNPAAQTTQQYWQQGQPPPSQPPPAETPPPGPPKSPRWLWILAAATVIAVVSLVIALMYGNTATRDRTAVPPLTTLPAPTSSPRVPTTTRSPSTSTPPPTTGTSPTTTPRSTATETVLYRVSGEGRAISIAYLDAGGLLQTEFNVTLPWSKEVQLTASSAHTPMVTVINSGAQVTCSLTVDGAQVRQRSGSFFTICSAVG